MGGWGGWGGGREGKKQKLWKRNCSNKISEKKNLKKQEILHKMGHILILNQCCTKLAKVLNIIFFSASGVKKKLTNTFYMFQEEF